MSLSKPSSNSSSVEAVCYNEDLMGYIFLQMPVKSVLKCRCVCKNWQSIASNPQFCNQHASLRRPNPSPSLLLFKYRSYYHDDISYDSGLCFLNGNTTTRIGSFDYLPKPPRNWRLTLVSSCNGLLLFWVSNRNRPQMFYVCNPTTKKFTKLTLPNRLTVLWPVDANLAFDPCVSPHYKVVLWTDLKDRYCICVYSSETKTWGEYGAPIPSSDVMKALESGRIFCNGKICWHVKDGDKSLSFDVEQGCLNVFWLPPPIKALQRKETHYFGASHGRLYLVVTDYYINHKQNTYVYESNEGCSGWVLKHEVRVLKDESGWFFGFWAQNLILSYVCEEKDEGSSLLLRRGCNQIVAYNLKEKTTNKVCDLSQLRYDISACQWIETLSCV